MITDTSAVKELLSENVLHDSRFHVRAARNTHTGQPGLGMLHSIRDRQRSFTSSYSQNFGFCKNRWQAQTCISVVKSRLEREMRDWVWGADTSCTSLSLQFQSPPENVIYLSVFCSPCRASFIPTFTVLRNLQPILVVGVDNIVGCRGGGGEKKINKEDNTLERHTRVWPSVKLRIMFKTII
jgi:hypothetical protein